MLNFTLKKLDLIEKIKIQYYSKSVLKFKREHRNKNGKIEQNVAENSTTICWLTIGGEMRLREPALVAF